MGRASQNGASLLALVLAALLLPVSGVARADDRAPTVSDYFSGLDEQKLIDVDSGTKENLARDLGHAEALLREGAYDEAAVALFAIVESPRYEGFEDFVEYQNSLYYLGVALARSGAYDSALTYLLKAMEAGPGSMYFAPAQRQAVDIALETARPKAILDRIESVKLNEPIPPSAEGERAYLRARAAYSAGNFSAAEAELSKISRKSRLYSSALYLRGIIRTRKGEFADAADSLCDIASTPDDNKFTFVVDDRYFLISDLARLGLGRIAHEIHNYDNAYYHYFQIPEDSDKLPDALFEAAWSMYQKRELATSRDLVQSFLKQFPSSPLVPEARLLAGYVDLADCEFTNAQKHYDALAKELVPIVEEIDDIRKDPRRRAQLFDQALRHWREEKVASDERVELALDSNQDKVLALLRFDTRFVKVHESLHGLRRAAGNAPRVIRLWQELSKNLKSTQVQSNKEEESIEVAESNDANLLLSDVRRLRDEAVKARQALRSGLRTGIISKEDAEEEKARLLQLERDIDSLESKAAAASEALAAEVTEEAPDTIKALIRADLASARQLDEDTRELLRRLEKTADQMAIEALDKLHRDTRQVLDKAKLGKIDAVIGQKRRLEIEVQDLASGRFPAELHGKLWEAGLIGDDEEFWPFEGEYWADEYEGWR